MDKLEQLKLFWNSFTGRMTIGVLTIHIFLTPVLFYGILILVEKSFQYQFVDQVRNDTFLYGSLLRSVVENGNVQKQIEFLNETLFNGDVVFTEFINNEGNITRPDSDFKTLTTDFSEDFSFGNNQDDIYYISIQLFSEIDESPLGLLRLGYDELPTQNRIENTYQYGALIAICYIVLSMLLVIFFGRLLIRPISELRNMARSIASGDHNVSLNVNTYLIEINNLVRDLDSMRQSLVANQKEIIDRERRLQAIVDNAAEGIISIDSDGLIRSFNLAAESIFGYTPDQVLGQNVSMLMPSPHRESHNGYINTYLQTGVAKIIGTGRRLQAQHKNGNLIPIYLNLSVVQQDQDYTFTGLVRDLTHEEEKDAQLQQLWRAVDQSPVTIMITDVEGSIQYVNPCFSRVTGYQPEEVLGKNPNILKSKATLPDVYRLLWKTISTGGVWQGVFQNLKKNGEAYWVSATICPIRDHLGNITHYISINEDITDVRKKESMLAQAMKLEAIGRMTDGIAHDFNNLLTIIRGNLRLLNEGHSVADQDRVLLEDALSASQDGADLIKRLMTFSRRQDKHIQALNINENLIRMERLLQRTVPDTNIEMILGQDVEGALTDANLLESAILNLVTNARDAMQDGGNIILSTSIELLDSNTKHEPDNELPPGKYVAITVQDNGIGMNDEVKRQAIEPFFTTKTIETGTGLGLTMVNDFVQQSKGVLRIKSSPGNGTSITLLLPSAELSSESVMQQNTFEDLPKGTETILVVEDQERVRRSTCTTLNLLGYQTYEAENALVALKELHNHKDIDLLFTDIVMPGVINGRQLAHQAIENYPTLKVLLTTGMEPRNRTDTRDSDNNPVLPKPYTLEQLAGSIREVLDIKLKA